MVLGADAHRAKFRRHASTRAKKKNAAIVTRRAESETEANSRSGEFAVAAVPPERDFCATRRGSLVPGGRRSTVGRVQDSDHGTVARHGRVKTCSVPRIFPMIAVGAVQEKPLAGVRAAAG